MMNPASTSNPSCIIEVYPYPSHFVAPNFVTMKLSGKDTYNVWETQILCLLKSHHMFGFIDGKFPNPAGNGKSKEEDIDAWIASDSLVKCWILGTLSDGVAKKVVNRLRPKDKKTDFSAKDLWDELQRSYGPSETKLLTRQAESEIEVISVSEEYDKRFLYNCIIKGRTDWVTDKLEEDSLNPWYIITNNGNTILHVAVGSSTRNHELLKKLLELTPKEKLLDLINSDGSSLLHVATIGGNIKAVDILVERNPELLEVKDKEGHIPLALSVSNMHIKTSERLFEHMLEQKYDALFSGQSGENLVVLAISCQGFRKCRLLSSKVVMSLSFYIPLINFLKYVGLARLIIYYYHLDILDDNDAVLTALAQNFPLELNFWERRDFRKELFIRIDFNRYTRRFQRADEYNNACWTVLSSMLSLFLVYIHIGFYAIVTAFGFFLKAIVHPFIKDTSQVYDDALSLLVNVCIKIRDYKDSSSNYHQYYNSSIFEATRRNSSTFIRIIIKWFPDAIWSTNEDGHNFIQYSVINRSEKIYNLLYEMSEHKNIYKTIKDSFGNNLLHLAARLAPTNKLHLILGAALQVQRELQWFKEVERFVCPLNRIQKNFDDETPQEVFTREHKGLVIEGEIWIKKTAESYTITAALIITIVFAAAITVPGGNNQESGIPIFTNNIAFKVFAISDAISLFTAVTSLLMFLSILTARFAEQDFLFKLPTKLIIGLSMLFISTTAMIIAFGATLFLVFGQSNTSMLIPIGALTCLPITSFVTLQFPLIVELIRATYCGGIFVREEYRYFY